MNDPPGDLAYRAMRFAHEAHKAQRRKYAGNPYTDHLAEVAGVTASVAPPERLQVMVATAWLHDCVEDQEIQESTLREEFGEEVSRGVMLLSDLETGNRATRKRLSCERLAGAPGWVQTIKVADLLSNTISIVSHDPRFAVVFLRERQSLLRVLTAADRRLLDIARIQTVDAAAQLRAGRDDGTPDQGMAGIALPRKA